MDVSPPPPTVDIDLLDKVKPLGGDSATEWVDNAVHQTLIAPKIILETLESALSATTFRLHQIKSTSSAHLLMTFGYVLDAKVLHLFLDELLGFDSRYVTFELQSILDSLRDLKSEFTVYEDIMIRKIKESFCFAAAHPFATSGVVFGSGVLAVKRTRHGLYYKTLRLFLSEEAMLSRATEKVQKLRDSVKDIMEEGKKLENFSLHSETELRRGRRKLRQARKQIQGVITSTYKIERQSRGLKDILNELSKRDASQFRSEVTKLASEAMLERRVLNKEIRKISNYGIPV